MMSLGLAPRTRDATGRHRPWTGRPGLAADSLGPSVWRPSLIARPFPLASDHRASGDGSAFGFRTLAPIQHCGVAAIRVAGRAAAPLAPGRPRANGASACPRGRTHRGHTGPSCAPLDGLGTTSPSMESSVISPTWRRCPSADAIATSSTCRGWGALNVVIGKSRHEDAEQRVVPVSWHLVEAPKSWTPTFVNVGDMRACGGGTRLGSPRSASEGAERDREWPTWVPGASGRVATVFLEQQRM